MSINIITNIIDNKLVGDSGIEPLTDGCKPTVIPIN